MSVSDNKKIVIAYIERSIKRDIVGMLIEPDIDNRIVIAVGSALQTLQDTFRIEEFTIPKVSQDMEDPTRLNIEFSFYPGRDFDWTIEAKQVYMHMTVSTLGVSHKEEERNLNAPTS